MNSLQATSSIQSDPIDRQHLSTGSRTRLCHSLTMKCSLQSSSGSFQNDEAKSAMGVQLTPNGSALFYLVVPTTLEYRRLSQ